MALPLKNSSPDPARTTVSDLQLEGSSTKTASTKMPAARHQDSPFLSLPLELRYMIYDYAFEYRQYDWT
ncbi:unnamed protein product, partial [Aureobasidium mustum]